MGQTGGRLRRGWPVWGLVGLSGLLAGCPPEEESEEPSSTPEALVLTTDYVTGSFALVDRTGRVSPGPELVNADAVVRFYHGLIYVVNRGAADSVQVIDPAQGFHTIHQFSTRDAQSPQLTNPQDIALVDDHTAYVALYATDYLLKVDARTGEELGRVSLKAYVDQDDVDGVPEAASVLFVDGTLYATVQRLTWNALSGFFEPLDVSYLLRIDPQTDRVSEAYPLTWTNPVFLMDFDAEENSILLCEAGSFGDPADGGLERVRLQEDGSVQLEPLIDEASLGGDVFSSAHRAGSVYAAVGVHTADGARTRVVEVDESRGQVKHILFDPDGWVVSDLEVDASSRLWVSDRTPTSPSLLVFTPGAAEPERLPFGSSLLPPSQTVFLHPEAGGPDPSGSP